MPGPLIRPMTEADIDELMPLERRSFKDPWTRRMYAHDITGNPMATYLVMTPPPEWGQGLPPILAWGGFWLLVDEAHISTIASHPDFRGCGLGQMMAVALLEAGKERGAARATLEVRTGNAVAQRLYEKLGFAVAGTRRNYYRDGEGALIMTTPPLDEPVMRARISQAQLDAAVRVARCIGVENRHGEG